jgi:hypothetical protein
VCYTNGTVEVNLIQNMKNQHGVDVKEALANAKKEGIHPSEITVLYKGLTAGQILRMTEADVLTHYTNACTLAKLTKKGKAMFAEKVTGFYTLGA